MKTKLESNNIFYEILVLLLWVGAVFFSKSLKKKFQ